MSIVETMGDAIAASVGERIIGCRLPAMVPEVMARAALRAVKPGDITDGMVEAYLRAFGGTDESVKKALFMGVNDYRRAAAAMLNAAGAEQ